MANDALNIIGHAVFCSEIERVERDLVHSVSTTDCAGDVEDDEVIEKVGRVEP